MSTRENIASNLERSVLVERIENGEQFVELFLDGSHMSQLV